MNRLRSFLAGVLLPLGATAAWANPTGGQVVSGAATITTVPGTVTINQTSNTAALNWQDFSIAAGELTRFQVPTSTSATLNRVTGGNISAIYGTLQSNGQLYLINPNGIVVGASGKIDTAGFLASTLNFSDTQFQKQGDLNLSGSSMAGISNHGTIHAATGDVYLIAAHVDNSGTISAPKGTVGLAAGNSVLLQKAGDRHLFVQVDGVAKTPGTGVANSGVIRAAAAELQAAGGNAYALAINNTGNIKATGIATINGQVYLTSEGGAITNSGTISAKQANGNGGTVVLNAHHAKSATKGTLLNSGTIAATGTTGGTVQLLGDRVGVIDHGSVDVSGSAGGGTALIGGDEHGANAAVPDADQTYLSPDATIHADALTLGTGGKVILWGNDTTQVYGQITARGGSQGGNGGFVETSAANLDARTAPDVSAPKGQGGTWLLDPTDITITDNAPTTSGYASPFTAGAGPYTLNQADLLVALERGNVTLDASGGTGGTGIIAWSQPNGTAFDITNVPGNTLTLNAPYQINLNGVHILSSTGSGSVNLVFNSSLSGAGNVTIANGSSLQLNGGSFLANGNGNIDTSQGPNASTPSGISILNSVVDAQGGDITMTGTGGVVLDPTNTFDVVGSGVLIGDSNGGANVQTSGTGAIVLHGTADLNIASGTAVKAVDINGAGTTIVGGAGGVAITGTLGLVGQDTGAPVNISLATGTSVNTAATLGDVSLIGDSDVHIGINQEIDVAGAISGNSVLLDSINMNLSRATVAAASGAPGALQIVDTFGNQVGQITISASTITGSNIQIGYSEAASTASNFSLGLSQVSIDDSNIQLALGANAPGTNLSLQINGVGSTGVTITNTSSITAINGGAIGITGTGISSLGTDTTGVLISLSAVSCGTSAGSSSGSLTILGNSDGGLTLLTPPSVYSGHSYGVQVVGSTISSYVDGGVALTGTAYAADNLASVGVDLSANTSIQQTGAGSAQINGTVLPEAYISGNLGSGNLGGPALMGGANLVAGLQTKSTQIQASGAAASISIKTDTDQTTATDNGLTSVSVRNVGAYFQNNTTIAASGSSTLLSSPIFISGKSGPAVAVRGNTQRTGSFGIWLGGGATTGPISIVNSGLGATILAGEGGATSGGGSSVNSVGLLLGDSNQTPVSITAPGGGSIGLAGVGGSIAPSSGVLSAQAVGVWVQSSNVTTTTGDIAILAAAGSAGGSTPASDLAGLELNSATIQTNTGTGGANPIPGGGSVPPLILIYATGSTLVSNNGTSQFQLGTPDTFAVREDTNSKLVTGDLVMGNYFDLFSAYAPPSVVATAPAFAQFNTTITTFNPAGLVDLISPLNQVSNLTAALDGSGGFDLYDSTSLVVGTIGSSDNLNYGQIDQPGIGPVAITVAANQNLTLTNVSAFTGASSGLPVIATGAGSQITLTTSGTGSFINQGGATALAAGSQFVIYANQPSQAVLNGITPETTLFSTLPGTVTSPANDTLAFASADTGSVGGGPASPGITITPIGFGTSGDPTQSVSDANSDNSSSNETGGNSVLYDEGDSLTADTGIVSGGSGASSDSDDDAEREMKRKLAKYTKAKAAQLVEIWRQDLRDGSTVNTGTVETKLTANTGFSKIVHVSEFALLPLGAIQLQINDPVIAQLFQRQAASSVRNELSKAAQGGAGHE